MIRDSVGDWQELSELYEQGDGLDAVALPAWLAALGANNHRLLPQLRRMLAARDHVAANEFMDALPAIAESEARIEQSGHEDDRIGPYRLIRGIGAGGMAEVWLAERVDGAFKRKVAIKLIYDHPARSQRKIFTARFQRERDFLASLDHPNIAGLHDAGVTPGGLPWLALEYVEGEAITAWCDAKQLLIAERVRLFNQVLLAVEAAHASLIIHRDIKPSNILVSAAGEVKLLDFGIAKLLDSGDGARDDTELTRQGGRLLTLHYASPEQLAGKPLTTATDVYSLGLVLYELLCGSRPYEARDRSVAQLERLIQERMPSRIGRADLTEDNATARRSSLKALRRLLAGDLEAVLTKSLSPLPADRYPSVEALRLDLTRWSENRPVSAKRTSAIYGIRKFWMRHRIAVSIGTAAVATLICASTVAIVMGTRAVEQSKRAIAARDFLFNIFREVDDSENGHGSELTAIQVLQAGRDKALVDLASQPDLQAEVLGEIGRMQQAVGDYKLADTTFRKVVELRTANGSVPSLAAAQIDLAYNAKQLGDATRASLIIKQAEALADSAHVDAGMRSRLLYVKGQIADATGDPKGALQDFKESLLLARSTFGDDDVRSIRIMRTLAEVESETGDYDMAVLRIREAAQWAARTNPGTKTIFDIKYAEASIEKDAGRFVGLPARLNALWQECDRLFGSNEEKCVLAANLAAVVLLRTGERGAALALLPQLIQAAKNESSPRRQLLSLDSATRVLAANGQLAAQADFRRRLIALAQVNTQNAEDRAYALIAVAESYVFEGSFEDAGKWAEESLAVLRDASQPSPVAHARAILVQGLAEQARGNDALALPRLRNATEELGEVMGMNHPLVHVFRLNQVVSLARTSGRIGALAVFDASFPVIVDAFGGSAPLVERARRLRKSVAEGDTIPLAAVSDFLT
jgi:serine/threonine protein kinase